MEAELEKCVDAMEQLAKAISRIFEVIADVIKQILDGLVRATTTPKQFVIYKRTKKARVRKKYLNRVVKSLGKLP